MPTPRADSYSVAAGGSIYAGISVSAPAWAAAISVGQIKAIAGTSGYGGSHVDVYCGWAYRPSTREIFSLAAGGHGDSYDNRVTSIDLTQNAPSWVLRKAPSDVSTTHVNDAAYYTDGLPSSRHTYTWLYWVPQTNRYMLVGNFGAWRGDTGSGAANNNVMDGFNPDANSWDAAGTWPWPASSNGYWGNAKEGPNGDILAIWGSAGQRRYQPASNTWLTPTVNNNLGLVTRQPWAWNSVDGYLFYVAIGDGQGSGTDLRAVKQVSNSPSSVTQTAITFNSSAALTQFIADQAQYPGMDFNPRDGCFYTYAGNSGAAGRIYKITPNAGTTWDMSIVTPAAGSVAVPTTSNGGLNSKFTFVSLPGGIEGFVFGPGEAYNLHFLRTA